MLLQNKIIQTRKNNLNATEVRKEESEYVIKHGQIQDQTMAMKKLSPLLLCITPLLVFSQDKTSSFINGGVHHVLNKGDIQQYAENYLNNTADNYAEDKLSEYFSNTEISIKGVTSLKPTIGILTVRPLYESNNLQDTVFLQGSFFSSDGRHTLNLGSGYRYMTTDERWLFGANIFFDQEFPLDHQRTSIGLEARSSILEFNYNRYFGLTGWKTATNNLDEKVLGGRDFELGVQLPYMPGSKIYHKTFKWDALNGAKDLKGTTTSISMSGNILIEGLNLEIGKTTYNTLSSKEFIQITYKYPPEKNKKSKFFSDEMYSFSSMKEKRLEKVRRENLLVKQQSGRGTISFR